MLNAVIQVQISVTPSVWFCVWYSDLNLTSIVVFIALLVFELLFNWKHFNNSLHSIPKKIWYVHNVTGDGVAEWLKWLTANPLCSVRVGLFPIVIELNFQMRSITWQCWTIEQQLWRLAFHNYLTNYVLAELFLMSIDHMKSCKF